MKKLPFYTLIFTLLFASCTGRSYEGCTRSWDRNTSESNYQISYYGLMGQELRHADQFRGYLHNDEGIDIWYIKTGPEGVDTTIQIMRGDFGTTIAKSWK